MVTGRFDITRPGLDLIQEYESFRAEAYLDSKGVPTIGYGTTYLPDGTKVTLGMRCTRSQAEVWFAHDCKAIDAFLDRNVTQKKLTQNQFNALASFIYNIGRNAFIASTMYKMIKAGDMKGAADQFMAWNKITVNGKKEPLDGLTNRRKKERALFLKDMVA